MNKKNKKTTRVYLVLAETFPNVLNLLDIIIGCQDVNNAKVVEILALLVLLVGRQQTTVVSVKNEVPSFRKRIRWKGRWSKCLWVRNLHRLPQRIHFALSLVLSRGLPRQWLRRIRLLNEKRENMGLC